MFGSALETLGTQGVTQAPAYDPWGVNTGPFAVGASYGYRGELHTGATVHLRNRDYDPASGTFLSPDPLDGVSWFSNENYRTVVGKFSGIRGLDLADAQSPRLPMR